MEEILRRIPHRPPFLFVDRIIEINPEDATCELNVREDLDIFKGHYPNNPIFPGVLSCEAIFQAGAIFLSEKIGEEALNASSVTPVLSRIRDARFKRMIKPGDTVVYIGCSKEQIRWGNNDDPTGILSLGKEYVVEDVEIRSQHTKLTVLGNRYNSVCFKKV